MRSLHRYQRLRTRLVGVVLIYPLIALSTYATLDREIFPFFWWELFSYIPAQFKSDYGLEIVKYDDQLLEAPLYFEEAASLLPDPESITAYITIQSLGEAITDGDDAEVERLRGLIEGPHLSNPSAVEYQIVKRDYDILEKWRCQCTDSETVIAEFSHYAPDASQ